MKKPHVVALLVPGGNPFELSVACEVFGLHRPEIGDLYDFSVCSADDHPYRTAGGLMMSASCGLDELRRADLAIVPAAPVDHELDERIVEALRDAHERGARLLSVCTGAFFLATAGLLDYRRATTHWMYADRLAHEFPLVDVVPDVLYVDEGDVLTSAGTAAGIDLCLYVVRQHYGADIANAIARRMVVPPHRDGGQAQFAVAPVPEPCGDRLAPVLDWAIAHLNEPIGVDDLAHRALMSPRTFARRFVEATATTPHQWLNRQRIALAQRLLETTDEPVEIVAESCGFGSAAVLRTHFSRQVGTTPTNYRRTFRAEAS